ncbi:branched-chain amino acid aminotransferase [Devriesea agamarum]|uniref:branched-chain amino acid aminotransferase n=1 Tax=Devriesea agamarum TaxID=472569 RepID=UPI00071E563A|nr:branched-chain amino acid aminotransferase [Devriesea agamarum]
MNASAFPIAEHPSPTGEAERKRILENPGFGTHFTDHMAHIRWTHDEGWHGGGIIPFGPIILSPAAAVLHYAQEIFEGMKAFRHEDGSIWGFRPERNAARFASSARRLALPELDEDMFMASVRELVAADRDWVPSGGETSLYLRPFMFASEEFLGVRPSRAVDYYCLASPAGAYFPRGVQPLKVWISREYSRAGRGGTGAAKCGGNYASSLIGKTEAASHGCDEVLFLDAQTRTTIDELSGMNVFAVYADGTLRTPVLSGSILEGITRESILMLAADLGLTPTEENLVASDLMDDIAAGRVREAFACGTAAVVNPIGEFRSEDSAWTIGDGGSGETTLAIRKALCDIQYGRADDTRGWMTRLV